MERGCFKDLLVAIYGTEKLKIKKLYVICDTICGTNGKNGGIYDLKNLIEIIDLIGVNFLTSKNLLY